MKATIILSFVILLSSIVQSNGQSTIKLPLKIGKQGNKDLKTKFSSRKLLSQNAISTPIINHRNYYLYMTLSVGNQGDFQVIVDTGSSILWVPATNGSTKSQNKEYNCAQSPTCKNLKGNYTMQYIKGKIGGDVVEDSVTIGGKKADKFPLIAATDTKNSTTTTGIIGLGKATKGDSPFTTIEMMKKVGIISETRFSLYLGPQVLSSDVDEEQTGAVVFGGYESTLFPSDTPGFRYVDDLGDQYCSVLIKSMFFGNQKVDIAKNASLIPDSGTTFAMADKVMFKKITDALEKQINAKCERKEKFAVCLSSISDLPAMTIQVSDEITFTLEGTEYAQQLQSSQYYVLLRIEEADLPENTLLLGQIFMRYYYIDFNFDTKQIGFSHKLADPNQPTPKSIALFIVIVIIIACIFRKMKRDYEQKNALYAFNQLSQEQNPINQEQQPVNFNEDARTSRRQAYELAQQRYEQSMEPQDETEE